MSTTLTQLAYVYLHIFAFCNTYEILMFFVVTECRCKISIILLNGMHYADSKYNTN